MAPFCRWQNRTIANTIERLIFITENEQETFNRLAPANEKKSVIYNIAVPEKADPHTRIPNDNQFKIACLSNFAWVRGVDRTAEIALALRTYGRRDIQFIMAGDMTLPVRSQESWVKLPERAVHSRITWSKLAFPICFYSLATYLIQNVF